MTAKTLNPALCLFASLALVCALTANAEPEAQADEATPKVESKPKRTNFALRYVPPKPKDGAPALAARIGGASRGPTDSLPILLALVPEHAALSSSEEPELFFWLSTDTDTRIDFALSDLDKDKPDLEFTLPSPTSAGIHRIKLSDHGIQLKDGAEYDWFISLIPDPSSRAGDVVAGGAIAYKQAPGEIAVQPENIVGTAELYAQHGYWYDALSTLSSGINEGEQNDLREIRASLLEQVGLERAASFDRGSK